MLYNKSEYIETVLGERGQRGAAEGGPRGRGGGAWQAAAVIRPISLPAGVRQQGEPAVRAVRQPEHRPQRQGRRRERLRGPGPPRSVLWSSPSAGGVCMTTGNTGRNRSSFVSLCFPLQTIVMNDCIIRGDLANVRVGRHCVVKSRSVIRPPFKKFSKG